MTEWFQYGFLTRALIAGLLVGGLASYYGVFVVQRRLSFLGAGLAHAALGGVSLGLLLETEPLVVALPFTILVAITINWIRENTRLSADTAIGILFAVAVSLGIIFLSLRDRGSADAFAYLFGSILTVSKTDLWATIAIFAAGLLTLRKLWGRWAYATFDEEAAIADGIRTSRDQYIFSVLLAVTIVVSIKVVGILLIAAFLVIPAAAARLLSHSFSAMTLIAVLAGGSSVLAGLMLSYTLDLPGGAVIILCQTTLFLAALMYSRVHS